MTDVTKMWAVTSGSYSDYRVLCLCPTEKDALIVASKLKNDEDSWHSDAEVTTFPVVRADVEKVPLLRLQTVLWDDDRESDYREHISSEWPFYSIHEMVSWSWRWIRAPIYQREAIGGGRLEVSGTNHRRVRKIFNDRRAELLAEPAMRMASRELKGRAVR